MRYVLGVIFCFIAEWSLAQNSVQPGTNGDTGQQTRKDDFQDYLALFHKVKFPYSFSCDTNFYAAFYLDNDLPDSVIQIHKQQVFPPGMLLRWVVNAADTSLRDTDLIWSVAVRPDRFYNEGSWYGIIPVATFSADNSMVCLIAMYEQTSATNGGFTSIWALVYNGQHKITFAKMIGVDGLYITRDTKDEDNVSYWKQVADYTTLKVEWIAANKIIATSKHTRETEMQQELPRRRNYTRKRNMGKERVQIILPL